MLRNFFNSPALRNALFAVLLLGSMGGLGYLAQRYHWQYDITFNASNSLGDSSIGILGELHEPLNITVFATLQDARSGDVRKAIREFITLYQRYKNDITLTFIDPEKEAEKARAAGIQLNGEMIIEYAGRSEHLTAINEQTVSSTLLRLAHRREQTIMYLDGHGERKLDGIANFDLGLAFGAKLKQNGFRINSLNLALAQAVPTNTELLVVTQPQVDLLSGEVNKLIDFIDRGGNLLWLVDAEPLHGLERVAEKLGLLLPPGIVIDPAAADMNAPIDWSLGTAYVPHTINRNFNLITAFPKARPLIENETGDWHYQELLEVAQRGWVSRNPNIAKPKFNQETDIPGPVTIAAALQRNINDKEQRVVIVGNGAFLSNSYAGNGGNVDWGINMINWLSGEEHLINVQPRAAKDSSLTLSETQLMVIGIGFLVLLPLLLAAIGGWIWWKRRRH